MRNSIKIVVLCILANGCNEENSTHDALSKRVGDEVVSLASDAEHGCVGLTHLATFETDQGGRYTFCEDDRGGVGVFTSTPAGGQVLESDCPRDLFMTLALPEVEVPSSLGDVCPQGPARHTEDWPIGGFADHASEAAATTTASGLAGGTRALHNPPTCAGSMAVFEATFCPIAGEADLDSYEWCVNNYPGNGTTLHTISSNANPSRLENNAIPTNAKATLMPCGGNATLSFWKKEDPDQANWTLLYSDTTGHNDYQATTWFAGGTNPYDHDHYRAQAALNTLGAGWRFGGGFVDCINNSHDCWD